LTEGKGEVVCEEGKLIKVSYGIRATSSGVLSSSVAASFSGRL
jgi:hypothetical protein